MILEDFKRCRTANVIKIMVAKVCALFLSRVLTGGSEMSISKTDFQGVGRGNNVVFPVNFAKFASNRVFFMTKIVVSF